MITMQWTMRGVHRSIGKDEEEEEAEERCFYVNRVLLVCRVCVFFIMIIFFRLCYPRQRKLLHPRMFHVLFASYSNTTLQVVIQKFIIYFVIFLCFLLLFFLCLSISLALFAFVFFIFFWVCKVQRAMHAQKKHKTKEKRWFHCADESFRLISFPI